MALNNLVDSLLPQSEKSGAERVKKKCQLPHANVVLYSFLCYSVWLMFCRFSILECFYGKFSCCTEIRYLFGLCWQHCWYIQYQHWTQWNVHVSDVHMLFTCYSVLLGEQSISLFVCLSVCEHISGTAGPIFTKCVVKIPGSRGSIFH